MGHTSKRITRIDGVTQAYHVGTGIEPPNRRATTAAADTATTKQRVEERVQSGRTAAAPPTVFVSTRQTAALMRTALREQFPGVKFAVRTGRGTAGLWINVAYDDGPPHSDVEAATHPFKTASFNAMTDSYEQRPTPLVGLPGHEQPVHADFACEGVTIQRSFSDTMTRASVTATGHQVPGLTNPDGSINHNAINANGAQVTWTDQNPRVVYTVHHLTTEYANMIWRTQSAK